MVVVVAALPLNLLAPLLPNRPVPLPNRPAPPSPRAALLLLAAIRAARSRAATITTATGTTAAASRLAAPRRRPAARLLAAARSRAAIVITTATAIAAASRSAASPAALLNPAAAAVEIARGKSLLADNVFRATNKRPAPRKVGPLVFARLLTRLPRVSGSRSSAAPSAAGICDMRPRKSATFRLASTRAFSRRKPLAAPATAPSPKTVATRQTEKRS
jgi:hypothetical protein